MPALSAPLLDVLVTVIFAAIGRRSHGEGDALTGIATVSWPFTAAALIAWLGVYVARRDLSAGARLSSGVMIWLTTVALGMVLRHIEGRGVAFSFVIVALIFNGLCMLGWRFAVTRFTRQRK